MTTRWVREAALVAMRWSGLAMAVCFAALSHWVEAAVAMLVALGQVVAWRSRLPLPWEVATSAACLFAATSSYLLLFERISWWDIPVHALLNGLLAVLVARVVRSPETTAREIIVTGAVLAVIWELMELAGHRWVDSTVYVAPADTALDVIAALAGSIVAALLWRRQTGLGANHGDSGGDGDGG